MVTNTNNTTRKKNSVSVIFPKSEPKIEIVRLDEQPFEVECRELRWWFIVPELKQKRRWAFYDYPKRELTSIDEMEVVGTGRVYGEECCEIRYRAYEPNGNPKREAFAYGALRDGLARWFGWWNLSDEAKFYTWRDQHFEHDWSPCLLRIADVGRYRWLDENKVAEAQQPPKEPKLDPIGAGLWLLRVGKSEHRCLRVIENNDPRSESGTLCEGFINAEGKVLLNRRYNAPRYPLHNFGFGGDAQEVLKDSLTLTYNDMTYYLWYDCLTEEVIPSRW